MVSPREGNFPCALFAGSKRVRFETLILAMQDELNSHVAVTRPSSIWLRRIRQNFVDLNIFQTVFFQPAPRRSHFVVVVGSESGFE